MRTLCGIILAAAIAPTYAVGAADVRDHGNQQQLVKTKKGKVKR